MLKKYSKKIVYTINEFFKVLLTRIGLRNYTKLEVFNMKSYPVTYLVNSKVACSSIKQILMSIDGVDLSMINSYRDIHKVAIKNGYRSFGKKSIPSDNFVFTVVRNPYSRVESLYRNKFVSDPKNIFFEFEYYLYGIFSKTDNYEEYLEKLININDRFAEKHFVSQTSITKDVKCSWVGKIECIDETWEILRDVTGIDFPNPKKQNSTSIYPIGFRVPEFFYDAIYDRYTEDFENFGYNKLRSSYNVS